MLIDHQDLKILKEKKPEEISYHKRLNNFFSYLKKIEFRCNNISTSKIQVK